MLSKLQRLFSRIGTDSPRLSTKFKQELQRIEHEEPRRVPVLDTGIPLHSPEKLIASQQEALTKIRLLSACSKEQFEQYYLSVIRRYAEYVHQLPASENHHHAGVGGLFRHGLEVAAGAFQIADDRIFDPFASLEKRRQVEPVYRYAVFVGGLIHDVGKAAYDIVVHDANHEKVWDPFVEPLYTWALRNQIPKYYVHYRRKRVHKKHELLSAIVTSQVLPRHCLSYLHHADPQILPTLLSAIAGLDEREENEIYNIICTADHNSVRLNLQGALDLEGHSFAGVTLPQHFINTCKLLLKTTIKVNRPGSKVYWSNGEVYLVYPTAIMAVIAQLEQDGVSGIPKDPDVFLSKLDDANLIVTRRDLFGNETPFWNIRFTKRDNSSSVKLKVIRLANPELLFPSPPGRAALIELLNDQGEVVGVSGAEQMEVDPENATPSSTAGARPATPKTSTSAAPQETYQKILKQLGEASAAGIFISNVVNDIKGRSKAFEPYYALSQGQLILLYPDAFNHYGLDPVSTSKELLEKQLLEAHTGQAETIAISLERHKKSVQCIRFTKGFTQSVCDPRYAEELEVKVIQNTASRPADEKKAPATPSATESPAKAAPLDEAALVNEYLAQVIAGHREKSIGFDVRIKEGIVYVQKKKSIQWFCDRQGNLSKADLERVLDGHRLQCEVPPDVQNVLPPPDVLVFDLREREHVLQSSG